MADELQFQKITLKLTGKGRRRSAGEVFPSSWALPALCHSHSSPLSSLSVSRDVEAEKIFIFICVVAVRVTPPPLSITSNHTFITCTTGSHRGAAPRAISHWIVWLLSPQSAEKRPSFLVWTFKAQPTQEARYLMAARVTRRSGGGRSSERADCPHTSHDSHWWPFKSNYMSPK